MKTCSIFILLLQTLLYLAINCNDDAEWIDPFQLETGELSKISENVPPKGNYDAKWIDPFQLETREISKVSENMSPTDIMAYYKRTVNLILSSVVREPSDSDNYKGRLFIDIPSEDYTFLKRFTSANIEESLVLQKVDQILTNILTKSTIDELTDLFIYWTDYIYFYIFNRAIGVCLIVLVILIVVYKLLKANFTPYQVLVYLLFLAYMIDFIFTWKRMLQELEINKYADSLKYSELPADCKLSKMSGWQFFLSFISETSNCRSYHKIILYDVFWDVGPLDVLAHQSRIMLNVGSNFGTAISKLTSGLMSDLPFPMNIILLPVLLIFTLFLIWSLLTYLTDTHIDLNLFHLVYIKFKTNKPIKDRSEESQKKLRYEVEEIQAPEIEKRKSTEKKKKGKRKIESQHENSPETSLILQKEVVENFPT